MIRCKGNGSTMSKRKRESGRCFGQDIMRGEYVVGTGKKSATEVSRRLAPGGGGGGAWLGGPKTESSDRFGNEKATEDGTGTSIFDPVLCELMYHWFCIEGGQIIDPFAGGSVRGIVAHFLGYKYWGCELRLEQVEANQVQAEDIMPENKPVWVCDDAANAVPNAPRADFIFSCPPYGYLEVYSDIEGDLSNMDYVDFVEAYRMIVSSAVKRLRKNSFACFVVANFRDKEGFYNDLVGDTVRAFEDAGARFYNEAIIVTAIGSLPVRVGKQFHSGRKFGKTHQNVLVFYKGDPKKIKEKFGKVSRDS